MQQSLQTQRDAVSILPRRRWRGEKQQSLQIRRGVASTLETRRLHKKELQVVSLLRERREPSSVLHVQVSHRSPNWELSTSNSLMKAHISRMTYDTN
jgi:hypothetical protein